MNTTSNSTAAKHVLIVDDEPDFADLLRSILEKAGYTVAVRYNCEGALAEVDHRKPDIISLDIHMPRRSGALFFRKLRANKEFHDIPIVVVTGVGLHGEMGEIVRSIMEADDVPQPVAYVEKPIDGPRYLEIVGQALASRSVADG